MPGPSDYFLPFLLIPSEKTLNTTIDGIDGLMKIFFGFIVFCFGLIVFAFIIQTIKSCIYKSIGKKKNIPSFLTVTQFFRARSSKDTNETYRVICKNNHFQEFNNFENVKIKGNIYEAIIQLDKYIREVTNNHHKILKTEYDYITHFMWDGTTEQIVKSIVHKLTDECSNIYLEKEIIL